MGMNKHCAAGAPKLVWPLSDLQIPPRHLQCHGLYGPQRVIQAVGNTGNRATGASYVRVHHVPTPASS